MFARHLFISLPLFLSSILALAGCGDDDGTPRTDSGPGPVDAGSDAPAPDAGRDSGPPSDNGTCAMPRVIEGMVGTVSVPGDTSDMREGLLDLGGCGNDASLRFAPQDVIEYHVPGTGPMGVTFTLINDGTPDNFDTVVQIRRGECSMIPPPEEFACFDDAGDIRSQGGFQAMGGDTVYIIVTGYGETTVKGGVDAGPYVLDITARTNDVPTITMGDVRQIGERIEVHITGEDDDMDPFAFRASFLDAMGMPVAFDFDGDGPDDGNQIAQAWNPALDPATPYTGRQRLEGLTPIVTMAGATQAALELLDEVYTFSEPVTVPIRILNEVGIDTACDEMNICADPLICGMTTMVCEPPPEIAAACMGAMDITLATPTTTATSATVMGTFAAGDGLFTAPTDCSNSTPGTEHIFNVVVPAGMFDLIVSTDQPGTGTTDTVVYVRGACADPTTLTSCSDDIDYPDNVATLVEVTNIPEGDYAIFVERWNGDMGPAFEMMVTLRPVLATGAACDPAGVMNRCAGMACSATTMMCP